MDAQKQNQLQETASVAIVSGVDTFHLRQRKAMNFYIFFLMLAFPWCSLFSQEETFKDAARLHDELSQAKTDTARIILKCRLGEAYRGNNPDTSLILANQAVSKARELGFKRGEVMALNVLCVLYREKGDLPNALQLGLQGVKIAEKEQLTYEGVYSLIRVANVYLNVGDASKALPYLQKAEYLLEKSYNDFQWSVTQYFLADSYMQLNQLDSTEKRVALLEKKYGSIPLWIIINNKLRGDIAVENGQPRQAISYFNKSMTVAMAENLLREAATASNSIAGIFKKLDQPDSAIYYAKQGLKIGEQLSYTNRILVASNLLAELYADENPKEAVRYYKMASAAKDSLYGVKKFQKLQSATMEEQERQAGIEAAAIAYQNNLKQWGLIGGVSVFFLVAIILYKNNRQKQKTNAALETTLSNLKATQAQLIQSEKMASLGELTAGIAHEIQNPLNFVNNFSEVSKELIIEMKDELAVGNLKLANEIASDVEQNLDKINHHGRRADAIVKGMLQHSRTSSGQKEPTDINALCDEYLRLAYHGMKAKDNSFEASFHFEPDDTLPKVIVVPQDIGRVLLNLINNAFQAVQDVETQCIASLHLAYTPTVTVSTKNYGGHLEISVRDNGSGIPDSIKEKIFQPFFTTKPAGQGTGLGLSLSYDIVKANRGDLTAKTKEGEGAEFIISLPTG